MKYITAKKTWTDNPDEAKKFDKMPNLDKLDIRLAVYRYYDKYIVGLAAPITRNPPSPGFLYIGEGSYAEAYHKNEDVEIICKPQFTVSRGEIEDLEWDLSRELMILARERAGKSAKKYLPQISRKRIDFGTYKQDDEEFEIQELVYSMPLYRSSLSDNNMYYSEEISWTLESDKIPPDNIGIPAGLLDACRILIEIKKEYGARFDLSRRNFSETQGGTLIIRDPLVLEDNGYGGINIGRLWNKSESSKFNLDPITRNPASPGFDYISSVKNPPQDAIVLSNNQEFNDDDRLDGIEDKLEELHRRVPLGISYRKDPTLVAIDPETNELYGVIYSQMDDESYDFDIIVDPVARRKGVAAKLIDEAKRDYRSNSNAFPDAVMRAHVVNPMLIPLLKRKGFRIIEDNNRGECIMEYVGH